MARRRSRTPTDHRQEIFPGMEPEQTGDGLAGLARLHRIPAAAPNTPGSFGCAARVAGLVSHCLDAARTRRNQTRTMVAARMSELTGETITESMLNAMTAESHIGHRFPLQWAGALAEATGCYDLHAFLAEQVGGLMLIGEAALDARLGQVRRQRRQLETEERRLIRLTGGGRG